MKKVVEKVVFTQMQDAFEQSADCPRVAICCEGKTWTPPVVPTMTEIANHHPKTMKHRFF